MVNQDRLAGTFRDLVEIDSVSRKEGKIAVVICNMLKSMGAHVFVDDAGKKTGRNTGNIVAGFPGNIDEIQPLLLNAHIDTVQPGENIKGALFRQHVPQ